MLTPGLAVDFSPVVPGWVAGPSISGAQAVALGWDAGTVQQGRPARKLWWKQEKGKEKGKEKDNTS